MIRLSAIRTGLAAAALMAGGAPVLAQTPIGGATQIADISVSQDADKVSILIKLNQQPKSATVSSRGADLVLALDGVTLAPWKMDAEPGRLIRHVEAGAAEGGGGSITLSGAAFGPAQTTIYRNAVLVEAKLAEAPPPPGATSLLAAATVSAPVAAPKPAAPSPAPPAAQSPAPAAKHAEADALPSGPVSLLPGAKPKTAEAPSAARVAAIAGLTPDGCKQASAKLAKDAWALDALGSEALCLIGQSKTDEARKKLDQLAAFDPEDWRVALGTGALADLAGDASAARIALSNARMLTNSASAKAMLEKWLDELQTRPAS